MRIALVFAAGALAACSSVHHPEYHPVTITNYSQDVSTPMVVTAPAPAGARGQPVYVVPGAGPTAQFPAPPSPPQPPEGWQW